MHYDHTLMQKKICEESIIRIPILGSITLVIRFSYS